MAGPTARILQIDADWFRLLLSHKLAVSLLPVPVAARRKPAHAILAAVLDLAALPDLRQRAAACRRLAVVVAHHAAMRADRPTLALVFRPLVSGAAHDTPPLLTARFVRAV